MHVCTNKSIYVATYIDGTTPCSSAQYIKGTHNLRNILHWIRSALSGITNRVIYVATCVYGVVHTYGTTSM